MKLYIIKCVSNIYFCASCIFLIFKLSLLKNVYTIKIRNVCTNQAIVLLIATRAIWCLDAIYFSLSVWVAGAVLRQ